MLDELELTSREINTFVLWVRVLWEGIAPDAGEIAPEDAWGHISGIISEYGYARYRIENARLLNFLSNYKTLHLFNKLAIKSIEY